MGVACGPVRPLDRTAQSTDLDPRFESFQWVGESRALRSSGAQPGKLAVTGFLSGDGWAASTTLWQLSKLTGQPADIAAVRIFAADQASA